MPAHPALTLHTHRTLDADPFHLEEETYLLMERARVTAESARSERYVDLAGNCFLRVDSDQRLQYSIDFAVLEVNGLADYYPGRALSDRAIAFATGGTQRHQFSEDGIFIYESASDEDPQGELRRGNVVISYDLHGGLDTATFPTTAGTVTYSDVPVQAAAEISNDCKNLLLQDIFHGESNLDADFVVACYNGDPAGAGTLVASSTVTDYWTDTTNNVSPYVWIKWGIRNPEIIFDSSGSSRSVTHIRLRRGSNVIRDIALAATLTVTANTYLRLPAQALTLTLSYFVDGASGGDASDENPAKYFLSYICGGTRLQFFPGTGLTVELYEADPGGNPAVLPVDTFNVNADSAQWTITGRVVDPNANVTGSNVPVSADWNVTCIIVKPANTAVWAMKEMVSITVSIGTAYSSATNPTVDIDDT